MSEVPRKPPLTPTGRAKTIATTHAALSGAGLTKAARPVQQNRRQARVYVPPTVAIGFDRLSVYFQVAASTLTGSSLDIPAWTGTYEAVGTSATLNSPDDGGLYLNTEGLFAVTASVYAPGIQLAASTCMVGGVLGSPFNNSPMCFLRGGDGVAGFTSHAMASTTAHASAGDSIFATLIYAGLDPVLTNVSLAVDVVRVR